LPYIWTSVICTNTFFFWLLQTLSWVFWYV
jgi:hypothetical protein